MSPQLITSSNGKDPLSQHNRKIEYLRYTYHMEELPRKGRLFEIHSSILDLLYGKEVVIVSYYGNPESENCLIGCKDFPDDPYKAFVMIKTELESWEKQFAGKWEKELIQGNLLSENSDKIIPVPNQTPSTRTYLYRYERKDPKCSQKVDIDYCSIRLIQDLSSD